MSYDVESHIARHLEGLAIFSIPSHKIVDKKDLRGKICRRGNLFDCQP
jgi:hypothetical protein